METKNLKDSLTHELKLFGIYALFFALFFTAFAIFRYLTVKESDAEITYRFGFNIIESLILAKIVLLGQHFHLGERFNERSLIIPTLYKTMIFSLFVLIFAILEEFAVGFLKGKSFEAIKQKFFETGIDDILGKVLLMAFVLMCYFAILETARVLGEKKLFNLFFRR